MKLPYAEPGILMAHVGRRALVVQLSQLPSNDAFRRHVDMLQREINERIDLPPRGVLYDSPTGVALTALHRKMLGEMLAAEIVTVQKTTAAYALATPSDVAQGALRAIFWQAPPPYPWAVVGSAEKAFEFFKIHIPEIDPAALDREYRVIVRTHARTLAGPMV
jgi:hypothetical protein